MTSRTIGIALVAAAALLISRAAVAAAPSPDNAQYAPYTFLIGTWDIVPESGGTPIAKLRVHWGPNKTYLWYAQSMEIDGKEYPHLEGMAAWNGVHKNLDMLFMVDLQHGLAQEAGTFQVEPDGTVIREITANYSEGTQPLGAPAAGPDGRSEHFRQTYRMLAADRILTTVMHETSAGWVPTFPGSDRLVMTRRKDG